MLVFHGWGMNSNVWGPVREQLESDFEVSWLDLPGHGINRDICADSLDEIIELIVPLVSEPTHLMGWSLGGIIAQGVLQNLAKHHQEIYIKSMTLVASTPRFSQADDWPNAMNQDVLVQFASNLQNDLEGTIKRFIALQFMGSRTSDGSSTQIQRNLSTEILNNLPQTDALITGLKILQNADLRSGLCNIEPDVPQHWIFGARDRLIPVEVADDLKSLCPDDQMTIFEDAGHAPFMTHPQEFVQSVTDFIFKNTK